MIQGNYNHVIKILSLTKSSEFNGFDNVVVGAEWVLVSNHVDYPDTKLESYGESSFLITQEKLNEYDFFINFEDLTENIVEKWVHDCNDHCTNMKRQHQAFLYSEYLFPTYKKSNPIWSN